MNRYTKSFFITFIVYIIIFVGFLYPFEDDKQLKSTQKKSEQIVKFTIIQEPIVIEEKKEIIVKKHEIKKIERIITKQTITKKLKPKVIEKKKKIIQPKQILVKQQIKQNKSTQKDTKIHQDTLKKRKENQNKYYTQIKETINKNKSYPKMAIKRGIEGIVKIQFEISKDGKLLSFNIIEGKRVFKKSIEKAVKNSFPLTPPQNTLVSNTSLSLMIDYRLY